MCEIVTAVAERDVVPILIEGLRRLEYRGYDSAGVAVVNHEGGLVRHRAVGRVDSLVEGLKGNKLAGHVGIAHTRWATHCVPMETNAHPHVSGDDLALVHNGIIENHRDLRGELESQGYRFTSDTDTEVIAHRINQRLADHYDLLRARAGQPVSGAAMPHIPYTSRLKPAAGPYPRSSGVGIRLSIHGARYDSTDP